MFSEFVLVWFFSSCTALSKTVVGENKLYNNPTPVMLVRRPPRWVPVERHRHLLLLLRRGQAEPGTPVPGARLRAGRGDVRGAQPHPVVVLRHRRRRPLRPPEVIDGGWRRGQGELRPSRCRRVRVAVVVHLEPGVAPGGGGAPGHCRCRARSANNLFSWFTYPRLSVRLIFPLRSFLHLIRHFSGAKGKKPGRASERPSCPSNSDKQTVYVQENSRNLSFNQEQNLLKSTEEKV